MSVRDNPKLREIVERAYVKKRPLPWNDTDMVYEVLDEVLGPLREAFAKYERTPVDINDRPESWDALAVLESKLEELLR